ncbi:MAG: restriction endonuclease subunit S, partial [Paludibacteraceae bacterium]
METKLQYVPLEELIELCIVQNTKLELGLDKVMGMNLDKQVIPTKANLSGNDLSKFYIVKPNEFIYNPRTHGKRIGLGFNETQEPFLISWNNIAFRVKATHRILPLYLYMYFCRSEWDREACFNSWGSSTEVFSWGALCKMRIPLPSIEEQEKVVSVWQGLRDIQQQNAALAKPLLQLCQSYIQECKHKY